MTCFRCVSALLAGTTGPRSWVLSRCKREAVGAGRRGETAGEEPSCMLCFQVPVVQAHSILPTHHSRWRQPRGSRECIDRRALRCELRQRRRLKLGVLVSNPPSRAAAALPYRAPSLTATGEHSRALSRSNRRPLGCCLRSPSLPSPHRLKQQHGLAQVRPPRSSCARPPACSPPPPADRSPPTARPPIAKPASQQLCPAFCTSSVAPDRPKWRK